MNISFDNPWLLLAAIPLIAFTVIPFFVYGRRRPKTKQRYIALVARILACLLLSAAISGLCVSKKTDKNSVVILADLSDSTKQVQDEIAAQISASADAQDSDTYLGLVTFGYNSEYELSLSDRFDFTSFQTDPDGNYTDIYSAVIKAAALLPENTNNRIILITDAKENVGKIAEAANVLNSRNIRLDAIVLDTEITEKEIQLSDIDLPDVIYNGEAFNITVTVESNVECDATLRLTEDGVSVSEQTVSLSKGTNRFVFRQTAETTGVSSYTAEISASSDWIAGNNKIYSFINILGTPKVLIIDGTGNESHELVKLLGDSVICDVCAPESAPSEIAELRKYESVILMNTAKDDLPEGFDSLLDVYVKELGRGLCTTGGSQSYILGGWQDSVLENILPINMTVKDEYELSDVGLMLLIDNSGSMGAGTGSPLELAKQGGIKAANVVKSIDKIGVIAFSDDAVWISELVSGSEKTTVQKKIASIGMGGGTMVNSALTEAYNALKDSNCKIKSIIMLTDGQPADGSTVIYGGILDKLAEESITVTSIAVGDYSDVEFLRRVSDETGGNVTVVSDTDDLPNIIYNEAVKAMVGSYLVNEQFYPEVQDYSSLLSGVTGVPSMDGYVMTEAKGLAYTVLKATDDKPLLATWQYGLGRVVSFTSDLNGKWSSSLLESENGQTLIRNIVSYILPSTDTSDGGSVAVTRSGDKGIISFTSDTVSGSATAEATVLSPSGKQQTVSLTPDGIGTYTGSFTLEEEGSYVVVASQKDEDGTVILSKESAMAVKYSDEYDMFSTDNGYVAECCEATGGRADWTDIASILKTKLSGAGARTDLSTLLLILSIIIIMTDIALRRLNINLFVIIKKKLAERRAAAEAAAAASGTPAGASAQAASVAAGEASAGTGSTSGRKHKSGPATEKTEEYKPEKKKKKKKEPKKKDDVSDASAGLNSLLKQVDDQRRKKM